MRSPHSVSSIPVSFPIGRMIIAAAASLLALASSEVVAQHTGLPGGPPVLKLPPSGAKIAMVTGTRQPVVEVSINGKGPFRFVLDTGAGQTMFDKKLSEELQLPILGIVQANDATSNAPKRLKLVKAELLTIGDVRISNVVGMEHDVLTIFGNEPDAPRGILGINLFADCLLTIDYPGNTLTLAWGELPPADGRDILKYETLRGLINVPVTLAGRESELTLDTGAALSIALAEEMKDDVSFKTDPVATRVGRRAFTEMEIREARIAGDLKVGRHVITNPVAHVAGIHSVMGYEILKNFALTIDQANQRVRMTRSGGEGPIKCRSVYFTGLSTLWKDDARQITTVIAKSPADRAGLRKGDRIETINGKVCRDVPQVSWRTMTTEPGTIRLAGTRAAGGSFDCSIEVACAVP